MASALDSSTGIVAYLALFSAVGFAFVFIGLLVGRFVRPANPHPEKLEIYECGEPAIGSSFVQFDLRFYVIALVFIIFDVEVAFLFPWATVFGKISGLLDPRVKLVQDEASPPTLTPVALGTYRELGGASSPDLPPATATQSTQDILRDGLQTPAGQLARDEAGNLQFVGLRQLMWAAAAAVGFFFTVLLVGFAYEWKTGALDWVRAVTGPQSESVGRRTSGMPARPTALSG